MSSPRLNNTIIAGCTTMYLSVFLFGLDGNLISSPQYSVNCQVRGTLSINTNIRTIFFRELQNKRHILAMLGAFTGSRGVTVK